MRKINALLMAFNVENNSSLALGFIKSYAVKDESIKANANMIIVDLSITYNDIMQALYYFSHMKPDLIGFSCYCWNLEKILELCRYTKIILPESIIVLGGPEVTPQADFILRNNKAVDFIVRGEGEVTFTELLKVLVNNEDDFNSIKGVSYRKGNEIKNNEERELIEDLDEIPSPYLTGIILPTENLTYISTYRGCPYKCAYCYEGKNYPKLRFFSDKRIEEEIKHLLNHDSVESFSIIDPVFNLNKKTVEKLTRIISENNTVNTRLHTIEIIAEHVDEDVASLLKKANVESVETGPQSINEDTVKNINRYFEMDKFKKGVKLLQGKGINVILDLIIGLPGDNFVKFLNSTRFVLRQKPSRVVFSSLHVLPGTPLFEKAKDFQLVFDENPPHYVFKNYSFSFGDIRKAEIFSKSLEKEYNLSIERV